MNAYVKYGLIFVGGAAVGGSIGWFVTKKKYEKQMDEAVEREVKDVREWYERHYEEDKELIEKADLLLGTRFTSKMISEVEDTEEVVEDESPDDNLVRAGERAVESYTERMNRRKDDLLRPERLKYDRGAVDVSGGMQYDRGADRVSYNSFSKPKIVEDIEEKEVDEVRLKQNDDDPRDDIYVISAEQFAHERLGFDKVTLYWWELERILSEEDMAILDVPDILGTGWEGKIGTEEKDVVYVRNENLETDYEVVVQHNSFYQMRDS